MPIEVALRDELVPKRPLNLNSGESTLIVNNLSDSVYTLAIRTYPESGDIMICRMVKGSFTQKSFEDLVLGVRVESDKQLVSDAASSNKALSLVHSKFVHRSCLIHAMMNLKKCCLDINWSINGFVSR